VDQISHHLNQNDCFVWVALKDPDEIELDTMRKEFSLHELAVEDARKGHQRPKIEEYGESIFVVLHTVDILANQEFSIGEIDIFVGKNYILSIRNQTKVGFANVRERCEREPSLLKHGSAFVLYALMDTVVDRYFPVIDKIEWELEQIEDRIFSRSSSGRMVVEEIYTLKRRIMILQHTVTSLLDSLGKLYGGRVPPICNGMQEYFRDVSDHVLRISKSIESIREMTTTAIQVNLSMISSGESEVTKKLASYGALFALPTSIAGIYGMNFKYMPELEWIWGYPVILISMILTDVLLWRRFRRAGWL
jgi:magnesium transporter